jgi:hypothetical protein
MAGGGGRKRGKAIAVLTGDLVRSSDLSVADLARARSALEHAAQHIAGWKTKPVVGPVEFFRGDAWQLALGVPGLFLRASILVRARLRAEDARFDTRIGVGLGGYDELNLDRTSLSTGEAFTISGSALDGLAGGSGISVDVPDGVRDRFGWVRPMAGLCSAIADQWTEKQALLVARMLESRDVQQTNVAAQLQVTRQSVSKQLLAADFGALNEAVDYVESVDWSREFSRVRYRAI